MEYLVQAFPKVLLEGLIKTSKVSVALFLAYLALGSFVATQQFWSELPLSQTHFKAINPMRVQPLIIGSNASSVLIVGNCWIFSSILEVHLLFFDIIQLVFILNDHF